MNLCIVDGPYGMDKYSGDVIRTEKSAALYRGVLARASLCDHVIVFGTFDSLAWVYEHCVPWERGLKLRGAPIWHKPDWTGGGSATFAPRHECLLHLAKPSATFYADAVRVPYGERATKGVAKKAGRTVGWQPNPLGARRNDILTFTSDRLTEKVDGKTQANKHPCVKPKALLECLVLACTQIGDVVHEPFKGSDNLKQVCDTTQRIHRWWENAEDYASNDWTDKGNVPE